MSKESRNINFSILFKVIIGNLCILTSSHTVMSFAQKMEWIDEKEENLLICSMTAESITVSGARSEKPSNK